MDKQILQHRQQIIVLAAKRGIHNVRLFGSMSRGESSENSDVDLLVDTDQSVTAFSPSRFLNGY